MSKDSILLLTKDAFCKDYLPVYGNRYWAGKTPNIDELASKGTVFNHFFTAAPSTVMAFRSMMFGKFPHETPYSNYTPMEIPDEPTNFFVEAALNGYKCHIIWDEAWVKMVLRYGNCFGPKTQIHNIPELRQGVGAHYNHKEPLTRSDERCIESIRKVEIVVQEIINSGEKSIVWIHLPHVLNGRIGYGDDIDIFDDCVGMLRRYFSDDKIFISADHGNMNGFHDKYCYGFDVYRTAIEIPFIAPRIKEMSVCDDYVSNVDIKQIIMEHDYPKRDFLFADSTYYAQPHRKLAIIHDEFLYIYNKQGKKEELYDLKYVNDYERCNMISDTFYDEDRQLTTMTRELFFSPRWDEVSEYRSLFRDKKKEVWREAPAAQELKEKLLSSAKKKAVKIRTAMKH